MGGSVAGAKRLRDRWGEALLVVAITLVAAALRFYALDRWPPGLYHDEAHNGLDALRVLAGERPVFFEANNGREPLYIYIVAAAVAALGRSPGAIRVVSAILGTLTIPATYLMARELLGRRVAVWAAALAATTFWTLNLSRIGFRAVSLPLVSALAIWSLTRALRRGVWWDWLAAGLFVGLSLYTYLAARFALLIWALVAGYALFVRRPRAAWPKVALFAAAALAVAAPLLAYAGGHPDAFLRRAGQLSVWSPEISGGDPWGTLARHALKTAGMFFVRGDFIPRHNLPYRPVFDPLMGAFFLVGAAWCALRRRPAHWFALGWVGIMALPTVLAEDAPHFLRAVGVLPVLFLLPALGLERGYAFLRQRRAGGLAAVALGLLLAISAAWTVRDYGRHVRSEAAYYNLEAGATEAAAEINRFLGRGWEGSGLRAAAGEARLGARVYVERRLWDGWTALPFLAPQDGVALWSAAEMPQPDAAASDVLLLAWPYGDYRQALSLLPSNALIRVAEGSRERGDLEQESRLLYVAFQAEARPDVDTWARFEQSIALVRYECDLVAPDALRLRLYWQALEAAGEPLTVFVHVRRGEAMLGQEDAPAARGYYPTEAWRAGDVVVDERRIQLGVPYDPAQDVIWVGLYRYPSLERLLATDDLGQPLGDHVIITAPCAAESD